MVLFNYATKELTAKVVYYGPGLCGKTTNLQFIHQNLPETVKGKMLSLATKTDRTLFFDFLPLDLGEIRGMKTRVQLYTVPGQVFYNETRKLVLKGVDGVVFVADSQQDMLGPNAESFKNLEDNLKGHGLSLGQLPHVIQFNKRDLPKLASIDDINSTVNKFNAPFYESVATTGIGVKDTLNAITKLVLVNLTRKYGASTESSVAAIADEVPLATAVAAAPAVVAQMASESAAEPAMAAVGAGASVGAKRSTAAVPSITLGSVEALPTEASAPTFDESEIDDLVNEVECGVSIDSPVPADESPVEVEMLSSSDAESAWDPPVCEAEPTADLGMQDDESFGAESSAELTLTEVAEDDDLFCDPNLEVARMATGEMREIVVPVEVGDADVGFRRYKLSLKLRLDPVD